jgi:hypothetical protein
VDPFWSTVIRFENGVFPLKNVVQLAVISATALPDAAAEGEELAGGADVGLALGLGGELEPLLPQAAMARLAAHASSTHGNLRVITQTFSSFRPALAMLRLTPTSVRRISGRHRIVFSHRGTNALPALQPGYSDRSLGRGGARPATTVG